MAKHGIIDVTEDHSLLNINKEIIIPCDLVLEDLLYDHLN